MSLDFQYNLSQTQALVDNTRSLLSPLLEPFDPKETSFSPLDVAVVTDPQLIPALRTFQRELSLPLSRFPEAHRDVIQTLRAQIVPILKSTKTSLALKTEI